MVIGALTLRFRTEDISSRRAKLSFAFGAHNRICERRIAQMDVEHADFLNDKGLAILQIDRIALLIGQRFRFGSIVFAAFHIKPFSCFLSETAFLTSSR